MTFFLTVCCDDGCKWFQDYIKYNYTLISLSEHLGFLKYSLYSSLVKEHPR